MTSEKRMGGPLGAGHVTRWWATADNVDMTLPPVPPDVVTVQSEPQSVTLDLARTAIVVIDLQNDFCTKDGWVDHIGGNYQADRTPIEPLLKLLPELRNRNAPSSGSTGETGPT